MSANSSQYRSSRFEVEAYQESVAKVFEREASFEKVYGEKGKVTDRRCPYEKSVEMAPENSRK